MVAIDEERSCIDVRRSLVRVGRAQGRGARPCLRETALASDRAAVEINSLSYRVASIDAKGTGNGATQSNRTSIGERSSGPTIPELQSSTVHYRVPGVGVGAGQNNRAAVRFLQTTGTEGDGIGDDNEPCRSAKNEIQIRTGNRITTRNIQRQLTSLGVDLGGRC